MACNFYSIGWYYEINQAMLKFTFLREVKMDVYKCIVAKLPKARTAVFRKTSFPLGYKGKHAVNLTFLYFKLDDEHRYFDG